MHYPIYIIGYLIDACWLVFLVYWLVNAFGNKKSIYQRQYVGLRIGIVFLAVLASEISASYYNYKDMVIVPYTDFTQIFGVALCAFGIGYAIWARKILGTNWSANPTVKEQHELIQTGPYNITRHPIYTGLLTALLGTFFAIIATWAGLGLLVVVIIGIYFKLRKEEQLMTQTFPQDYPAYKQRVPYALIPYIF